MVQKGTCEGEEGTREGRRGPVNGRRGPVKDLNSERSEGDPYRDSSTKGDS